MLSRREPSEEDRSGGELNTIIGRGSVFEGKIKVQSSLRVDGRVQGNVHVSDSLIVGKEGEIDGEIRARNAIIGGKVRDKILASGRVVLESKSVVYGDIKTARLVIDEGAMFEGKCSMSENENKMSVSSNTSGQSSGKGMNIHSKHEMAVSR